MQMMQMSVCERARVLVLFLGVPRQTLLSSLAAVRPLLPPVPKESVQ